MRQTADSREAEEALRGRFAQSPSEHDDEEPAMLAEDVVNKAIVKVYDQRQSAMLQARGARVDAAAHRCGVTGDIITTRGTS
jgi:hypothetical protein